MERGHERGNLVYSLPFYATHSTVTRRTKMSTYRPHITPTASNEELRASRPIVKMLVAAVIAKMITPFSELPMEVVKIEYELYRTRPAITATVTPNAKPAKRPPATQPAPHPAATLHACPPPGPRFSIHPCPLPNTPTSGSSTKPDRS